MYPIDRSVSWLRIGCRCKSQFLSRKVYCPTQRCLLSYFLSSISYTFLPSLIGLLPENVFDLLAVAFISYRLYSSLSCIVVIMLAFDFVMSLLLPQLPDHVDGIFSHGRALRPSTTISRGEIGHLYRYGRRAESDNIWRRYPGWAFRDRGP